MTSLKTLAIGAALTVFSLPAWAETDITFWHSFGGGNGKALEQIISDFEKKRPDIKVTAQEIGDYNDIVTKLQAAIPAKRYPDVVLLEITRYGLFAEKGILENLTPYLDKDPLKEQLYDFALDVGKYKGSNYVIPFNSSTPVTYYNKALLRAAGLPDTVPLKNFNDLLGAAKTVQEKLGSQGKFGISPMGQFARWGIVMSNDSDLIDPVSNDVIVDSPKTIAAYEWMADLVRKYKVASVDGITDENAAKAQFTAGNVAINLDSTGVFGGFKKALGDDLGVAPFPCEAVCRVPIGGAGIGIVSMIDDEKKKAAYDFISYMASPEANAIWFAATGYLPINKKTLDIKVAADAANKDEGITISIKQIDYARGRPRPPVVTWMRKMEYGVWESVALGQKQVPEALKELAAQTKAQTD